MKTTPFYNIHQTLKAKIVPFAGFMMPVEYTGINDEHICVRSNAGVFDVSHMGEIWVKARMLCNSFNMLRRMMHQKWYLAKFNIPAFQMVKVE